MFDDPMHAFVLHHYPDGIEPTVIDAPTVGDGQVAVRLDAIAVNPLDWRMRNGWLAQMIPLALPTVVGTEGAGTVTDVGSGVTGFTVGDRVAGFFDSGAHAEKAVTRPSRLVRVPEGLSIAQAAALPTAAEAALRMLRLLRPTPASTLVVNGAAGSVGSMLTQLLIRDGHRVLGTAGGANHDYLRDLGAVPVNYGDDILDDLRRAAPEGIDAGYDATGFEFVDAVAGLIDPRRIVTLVDFAAEEGGAIVAAADPMQSRMTDAEAALFDLAARGEIRVEIGTTYRFEDLIDALTFSEQGHLRGKVIIAGYGREPADIVLA